MKNWLLMMLLCCVQLNALAGTHFMHAAEEGSLEKMFDNIIKQTAPACEFEVKCILKSVDVNGSVKNEYNAPAAGDNGIVGVMAREGRWIPINKLPRLQINLDNNNPESVRFLPSYHYHVVEFEKLQFWKHCCFNGYCLPSIDGSRW